MSKPTDIALKEVRFATERIEYRTPIKFGGRVVTDVVIANVHVVAETRDGRRGDGFGSMPIGNVWAWPSTQVEASQSLAAMVSLAEQLAAEADNFDGAGHPLELTHELAASHSAAVDAVLKSSKLAEPMPRLAQLVCASPLEAAIHDAYGRALGLNSYNLLGKEFVNADLSHYLTGDFASEYLDRYTLREPKPRMPLYHLVRALDPLAVSDIAKPVGDGLPEMLGEWIVADGLTHLKIKLAGDNLPWDVERVARVETAAIAAQRVCGCTAWKYSLDFNEKCENVAYILEFLAKLQECAPAALARVQYIEQPTHRDLKAHPENKMHAAARIKPVVIDESLIDLESLLIAREQGYSGVALKICKGHSEALLMGAAAQKFGMFLCVQDLTCPGYSFLHSADLAARVPTIAAIEGNSRQYCPAGNASWAKKYPSMFRMADGTVGTGVLTETGLGFSASA